MKQEIVSAHIHPTGKTFFHASNFSPQTRLKPAHSSFFLKRRFPFKPCRADGPRQLLWKYLKSAYSPRCKQANQTCTLSLHVIKQTMQCTYPYTPARNPHNPVWGLSFFHPHSQGRRDRLKKESMNISLSGNSGSGDCRQEFWLAREDLQNVGSEPRGCLASRAGNLLQTSSSPSYP